MSINNEILIITILVILNIVSGFIGYIIGRLNIANGVYENRPQSFFTKNQTVAPAKSALSIDDKKFVVDIKTDGLERKYDTLGDIKKTEENINNSVNKLKNLKG